MNDLLVSVKNNHFYQLGEKYKSDKINQHGYHFCYPNYLEKYKNLQNTGMIEIGIENKYSLKIWLDYFPNAFVYGMDIHFSSEDDRYKIYKGDQSNIDDLINFSNDITKPIFFIIDDGSHIPEHQILTFNILFEKLLPGGTYIIEDIETSYWSKSYIYQYSTKYGYHHNKSVVEFFKLLVDDVNSEFLTNENKNIQKSIINEKISEKNRKNISTITFYHNCIIITKKTQEEIDFYGEREYYWKEKL
jgi:hypothetical protein